MTTAAWDGQFVYVAAFVLPAACAASSCGHFCESWCKVATCLRLACNPRDSTDCPGSKCIEDCGPAVVESEDAEAPSGKTGGGTIVWIPVSVAITCFVCISGLVLHKCVLEPIKRRRAAEETAAEIEKSKWFGGDNASFELTGKSPPKAATVTEVMPPQTVTVAAKKEKMVPHEEDESSRKKYRRPSWEARQNARAEAASARNKSPRQDRSDAGSPRGRPPSSPRGDASPRCTSPRAGSPNDDGANESGSVGSARQQTKQLEKAGKVCDKRKKRLEPLARRASQETGEAFAHKLSEAGEQRLRDALRSVELEVDSGIVPCRSVRPSAHFSAPSGDSSVDDVHLPAADVMLPMSKAFSRGAHRRPPPNTIYNPYGNYVPGGGDDSMICTVSSV